MHVIVYILYILYYIYIYICIHISLSHLSSFWGVCKCNQHLRNTSNNFATWTVSVFRWSSWSSRCWADSCHGWSIKNLLPLLFTPNLLGRWEHPAQMWYHSFCFILLQCTVQGNHSIATRCYQLLFFCRVTHAAQINWAPRRTVAFVPGCLALVLEISPTPGPQQWTTERRRWTRPNLFKVDSEKTGLAKIGSRERTVYSTTEGPTEVSKWYMCINVHKYVHKYEGYFSIVQTSHPSVVVACCSHSFPE